MIDVIEINLMIVMEECYDCYCDCSVNTPNCKHLKVNT